MVKVLQDNLSILKGLALKYECALDDSPAKPPAPRLLSEPSLCQVLLR